MRNTFYASLWFALVILSTVTLMGCPTAPSITSDPVSLTVNLGASASFTVTASGTEPLTYLWSKGGAAISGATSATYSIAAVQKTDEGSYTCTVSNSKGSATSAAATLTVLVPALSVTPNNQPVDAAGGTATFTVSNATADTTMNWTATVASADTWLSLNNNSGTNAGTITATAAANSTTNQRVGHITVTAADATGSPVTVTVTQAAAVAPSITTQPLSQTVKAGDSVSFTVVATGTAPLIYQWAKGGSNITDAIDATYTIAAASNANEGEYTCTVTNGVGNATSNPAALDVRTDPVAAIVIKGLSSTDVTTLGLSTTASSGLSNVGKGTDVYLVAEASDADGEDLTYDWSIAVKPTGSEAAFVNPNPVFDTTAPSSVVLHTDLEGTYVVELDVNDGTGSKLITSTTKSITAGQWVGAGIVAKDGSSIANSTCTGCHNETGSPAPDKFTPWLQTGHATYFAKAVDGNISPYYGASCIGCHTVGYDTSETAVNNGFDDIQTALGWVLPSLAEGNWLYMTEHFPTLARRGGIQCENCHGPASQHPNNAFSQDIKMDASLNADVCGQCHGQNAMWKTTGHADGNAEVFTYPIGTGHEACVKCHSGLGYIDNADGVPQAQQHTGKQVISCAVCHDPHDSTNPGQLRVYDAVALPGDTTARTGMGQSATCMSCHNGRVAPDSATAQRPSFPHHSTASENLLGVNGITFGQGIENSSHASMAKCVDCHMAPTPGNAHDAVHTAGENEVGDHTFRMAFHAEGDPDDGFENVANACNGCHGDLTVLNRTSYGDYDGDGQVEGIQDEVEGLMALVLTQLQAKGLVHLSAYPYWSWTNVAAADLQLVQKSVWNYMLVEMDGSKGIHNTGFTVGLLQVTYKQLAGVDVPGATLRYTPAR